MKGKYLLFLVHLIVPTVLFSQWTLQSTVTGLGSYPSISVYSPNGVVIAGGLVSTPSAKVFKSTNSGLNWIDISGDLPPNRLYALWAVNENLIFVGDGGAAGIGAKMWKTTNGGTNWTLVLTTGVNGFFNGIVFSRTNPMIGIAQSDPTPAVGEHYLAKTTDGGNTWLTQTTIATGGAAETHSIICIDNFFYGWGIYSAYGQKRILLTTDGGATWNIRAVNLPGNDYYVSGLAFSSDKTTAIAASMTNLPIISRSADSGINWSTLYTGLPITSVSNCRMKWVYGTNWCYLTGDSGSSGCVGKSTNGGLNWTVMSSAGVTNLYHIELIYTGGTVYAYATAKNGSIIRLQETVTGIKTVSNEVPSQFSLHQNYPNPFNPVTKIKFNIPSYGFPLGAYGNDNVTLKVFDLLGREVFTLVNEKLQPGTYEVTFDASNLTSGIYFYQLKSGDFISTKKLILLK